MPTEGGEPGGRRDAVASHRARLPSDAVGYVVSISGKRLFRRLHRLGGCHRVPGVDYREFELLGVDFPPSTAYDGHCAQCWRDATFAEQMPSVDARPEQLLDDEAAADHSTDASSSTEEE